jgi:hypothetical protein
MEFLLIVLVLRVVMALLGSSGRSGTPTIMQVKKDIVIHPAEFEMRW